MLIYLQRRLFSCYKALNSDCSVLSDLYVKRDTSSDIVDESHTFCCCPISFASQPLISKSAERLSISSKVYQRLGPMSGTKNSLRHFPQSPPIRESKSVEFGLELRPKSAMSCSFETNIYHLNKVIKRR